MNAKVKADFEDQNIRSACNIMYANDIGCLKIVIYMNNKMVGIIIQKDIFSQIATNPSLITEFNNQNCPEVYREVHERFPD